MTRALSLRLRYPWNVIGCCLLAMTGAAENLKIAEVVGSAERPWNDVIHIPELTGIDLGVVCPLKSDPP